MQGKGVTRAMKKFVAQSRVEVRRMLGCAAAFMVRAPPHFPGSYSANRISDRLDTRIGVALPAMFSPVLQPVMYEAGWHRFQGSLRLTRQL